MKALILIAALVFSGVAHAEPSVIAQAVISGGLMAPDVSNTYTVRILDDGKVVSTTPLLKQRVLATLDQSLLNSLIEKIEAIDKSLKLVAIDPTLPICYDAPSTVYQVIKKDGSMVLVGAVYNCVEQIPSEYSDEASDLVRVLTGLLDLSRI